MKTATKIMLNDAKHFVIISIPFILSIAVQIYIYSTMLTMELLVPMIISTVYLGIIMIVFSVARETDNYDDWKKVFPTRIGWYIIGIVVTLLIAFVNSLWCIAYFLIAFVGLMGYAFACWYRNAEYRANLK